MTRERRPSKEGRHRRLASVLLVAALLLPAAIAPASSADKNVHSSLPPRSSVPVRPIIPAASAAGICQCIADQARRRIGCVASADECKAMCGDHYSFVPHAPSCPITAQGQ
jgi:hypothetical protein